MQRLLALALLLVAVPTGMGGSPSPAADRLAVVATIPDLADIAREIGGERVEVTSLARGTENIHGVAFRPSMIISVSRADLFLQMGLALEHAFVPGLLSAARNKDVLPGGRGFVNCSEGWEAIDVPQRITRKEGADVHPWGNPHFNLDPRAGAFLADRILEGLVRIDPKHQEAYEERHATYVKKVEEARKRWAAIAERVRGKRVVQYHEDFDYLLGSLGLEIVGTLEPKPGVSPTPRHLIELMESMRSQEVGLILTAKWSNNRHVDYVSEKTGVSVFEAPTMVGGSGRAKTWIALMDELHQGLDRALGVAVEGD